MRKTGDKLLSLVIAFVMICALLPFGAQNAYAENQETSETTVTETTEAATKDETTEASGETETTTAEAPAVQKRVAAEVQDTTESKQGKKVAEMVAYGVENDPEYHKFLNFESFYQPSKQKQGISRYTVLSLDVSGSMGFMNGEPMDKMKQAAKRFCREMLKADGNNYIAITTFAGQTIYKTNFTDSYEYLEHVIDSMEPIRDGRGGTNIEAGIRSAAADILYHKVPDVPNVIKNIVVMTDGSPTHGTFLSKGIFSEKDTSELGRYSNSYGYANGVVDYVKNPILSDVNIYSFGFFHSLEGQELAFGRKLIKAIQNAGSYEVTDPNKLEFEFGGLVSEIVNNDPGNPIIIVPGIMGSNLYSNDKKLWPPADDLLNGGERLAYNTEVELIDENGTKKTYEKGISLDVKNNEVNQNDTKITKREYGANNTYENLVDGLCAAFPNRPVYFFSYDWRLSNENNAEELKKQIEKVIGNESDRKVDIVAHSMGGLVTSRYVQKTGGSNVDKIITCGTPYEGSPALLDRSLTYRTLDKIILDNMLVLYGINPQIKKELPSLAELSPTDAYCKNHPNKYFKYEKVETPSFREGIAGKPTKITNFHTPVALEKMEVNDFENICRSVFSMNNYEAARAFHKNLKGNGKYNILRDRPNTYFVVGIGQKTIESVAIRHINGPSPHFEIAGLCYETGEKVPKGDGTVPYDSATMNGALENIGQDSIGNERFFKVKADHGETANCKESVDYICSVLNGKNANTPIVSNTNKGYLYVRVACPVEVSINSNGETLSSDGSASNLNTSFGRLDFSGDEGDIKHLCLDEATYPVTLKGTGDGTMDLSLEWRDENNENTVEKHFLQIPVSATTLMSLETNKDGVTVLNVDSDGNGSADEEWYAENGEIGYKIQEKDEGKDEGKDDGKTTTTQPTSTKVDGNDNPKTGDTYNALLLLILAGASVLAMAVIDKKRRAIKQ